MNGSVTAMMLHSVQCRMHAQCRTILQAASSYTQEAERWKRQLEQAQEEGKTVHEQRKKLLAEALSWRQELSRAEDERDALVVSTERLQSEVLEGTACIVGRAAHAWQEQKDSTSHSLGTADALGTGAAIEVTMGLHCRGAVRLGKAGAVGAARKARAKVLMSVRRGRNGRQDRRREGCCDRREHKAEGRGPQSCW